MSKNHGKTWTSVTALALLCLSIGISSTAAQSGGVPDGLYLRFNEGAGTGTQNEAVPGTLAPSFLSLVPNWVTSPNVPFAGASALDPVVGSFFVPSLVTGQPYSFTPAWTIEFAIDLNANAGLVQPNFSTTILEDNTNFLTVAVTPLGNNVWIVTGNFLLSGPSVLASVQSAPFSPSAGWTFISIVYDPLVANTLLVYVDGALNSTIPVSPIQFITISSTNPSGMTIGGTTNLIPFPWPAQPIDELRIWNSARSPAEILAGSQGELGTTARGLRVTPGATLTFNRANSTFSASGTISGLILDGGAIVNDPTADPVIGRPFTASGNYSGTDLGNYSDIVLAPASITIQGASSANTLTLSSIFAVAFGSGSSFALGGPLGVLPIAVRPMASPIAPNAVLVGSGSTALDSLNSRVQSGSKFSMVIAGSGTSPDLLSLETDYLPPITPLGRGAATNGSGAFALGIVGCPVGSLIYNVFVPNPVSAAGQGPFFGLDFSVVVLEQINAPLPTNPFRVQPNVEGNYFFGVPNGTLPAGLVVDTVTIIVNPTTPAIIFTSPATRLTF